MDTQEQTTEVTIPPLVAVDTETEEFDYDKGLTPRTVKMQGMSVAFDGERAVYWTDTDQWKKFLGEVERGNTKCVFHHAKFDLLKLQMAGLPVPKNWEDTKIAATLIDENNDSGLKNTYARLFVNPLASRLTGKEQEVRLYKDVDRADDTAFAEYAANDARFTLALWEKFQPQIEQQELTRVYELEKAVVPVAQSMEGRGMLVDRDALQDLGQFVLLERARTLGVLLDMAGDFEFEPNSVKQCGELLYDELGLQCQKKTKGGKRSVDSEALSYLDHPIADAILEYREYQKMATAFTEKYPTYIEEDGRIHAEFNPLGAKATGRWSCKNPNLQQVPSRGGELAKRLRNCFVAAPGHKLIVADYSQMELRVLAHYSEDPILLAAYNSADEPDLHIRTASLIFNKPESDVEKNERGISKTANFAISYGITPIGLFKRLKALGIDVTLQECIDFIDKWFGTFKGVKAFLERVERVIKRRGYVMSLYGRRRRVRGRTPREIRQAQNFIIQSSAADLCKQALVDVYLSLPETGRFNALLGDGINAMIHDELIVECRDDRAEQVRDLVVEMMTRTPDFVKFKVPIKVDAHIVDRWGDAK